MPVLPFHRYIGPGNDINSGPCVDADDCIAKKHDIKYENAKTPEDVRLADVEAIEEFRANWLDGNWHSIIGDIGLSLKYCVETYTGVIYPKLGTYEPCEVITLFHDLIKLHCLNKARLFDRHAQPIRPGQTGRMYDFTKFNENYETVKYFFFLLVIWFQLYHKRQEDNCQRKNLIHKPMLNSNETNDIFLHAVLRNSKYFPVPNSAIVKSCDIFNLNTWIRFFSTGQQNQQPSFDNYNDEELSNLFLLYD